MMPIARIRAMVCMCVAVTLLVTSVGGRHAAASQADGRFIVVYLDGTLLSPQASLLEALGVEVTHVLTLVSALSIIIPLDLVGSVLQQLLSNPLVVAVYDDPEGSAAEITPTTSSQSTAMQYDWGVERIKADAAQQVDGVTGNGVTVAVLDSGVDRYHPYLQANIVLGFNALPGGGPCEANKAGLCDDMNGHGTHTSGIIAAAANSTATGTAYQGKIAPVVVLDANGNGRVSDLVYALQWVSGKSSYRVVNMSLVYPDSPPLSKAIDKLYNKGKIMVAAAGNCSTSSSSTQSGVGGATGDGGEEGGGAGGGGTSAVCDAGVGYPARYPRVIAVGATNDNNQITSFSRYNADAPEVDLVAPGENIVSTTPGGGFGSKSGTSMAAAFFSGSLALALQKQSKLTFGQLIDLVPQTTTDLGYSLEQQGYGLMDAQSMVEALP